MQFVCDSLHQFFNKSKNEAYEHMMEIHITGTTNLGTYPKDIAESKIHNLMSLASSYGYSPILNLTKKPIGQ